MEAVPSQARATGLIVETRINLKVSTVKHGEKTTVFQSPAFNAPSHF